MKATSMEAFQEYVLTRRDMWEVKYGLKEAEFDTRYIKRNLPNNLKYLDTLSQRLIRVLARSNADIEAKLLTCFIYRLIPNATVVNQRTRSDGIVDLEAVEKIGKSLDRFAKRVTQNNHFKAYTPVFNLEEVDVDYREQFLKACVASFLYHLPNDLFQGWTTRQIYLYLMEKKITGVNDFIAYQLCTDFSYISELKLRVGFIPAVPDDIKPKVKLIIKKYPSVANYRKFVFDTISWYNGQEFLSDYERLISPHDVFQMVMGYKMAMIGHTKAQRRSKEGLFLSTGDFKERSILLTESVVEGYAKSSKVIHNQDD